MHLGAVPQGRRLSGVPDGGCREQGELDYSHSPRLSKLLSESLQIAQVIGRCSEMLFATQGAEVLDPPGRIDETRPDSDYVAVKLDL